MNNTYTHKIRILSGLHTCISRLLKYHYKLKCCLSELEYLNKHVIKVLKSDYFEDTIDSEIADIFIALNLLCAKYEVLNTILIRDLDVHTLINRKNDVKIILIKYRKMMVGV